jgi:23S rRNA G2445 N2-methylase RlmL
MGYRSKLFDQELERLREAERTEAFTVYGSDYSSKSLASASANAELAGVKDRVSLMLQRVTELKNPCPERGPGLILTNPPYGERINERIELEATFRKMGDRLKTEFSGWECWMLLPDDDLAAAFGLRVGKKLPLKNGPLDVFATQLFVD